MLVQYGSYTGDGLDNKAITGVGFRPDVVIVKVDGNTTAVWKNVSMGTATAQFSSGSSLSDSIKSLDSDGFTVGTGTTANTSGNTYYYVALKANGMNDLATGSYTGTGSALNVTGVTFQPEFVLVKRATSQPAIFRTTSHPVSTSSPFTTLAELTDGITTFNQDGFTVGTHVSVNVNTAVYYYLALKTGEKFKVGTYTGNGVDDRSITISAGFGPDFVSIRTDGVNMTLRTTSFAAGVSGRYSGTVSLVNAIQAFEGNGFQVGTNSTVNADGLTYYWYAFAKKRLKNLATGRVAIT